MEGSDTLKQPARILKSVIVSFRNGDYEETILCVALDYRGAFIHFYDTELAQPHRMINIVVIAGLRFVYDVQKKENNVYQIKH